MEHWSWLLFMMIIAPICDGLWQSSSEEVRKLREERRGGGIHYHTKRHMLPNNNEAKKRPAPPMRVRENRKKMKAKPSGHLTPLKEDDIDNDEVVSVAIGPPPMRPMYDKMNWKYRPDKNLPINTNTSRTNDNRVSNSNGALTLVKDVLTQIGREFLSHQVNEDFVFGQYVGQAMKNITNDQKLKFQHDILELVIKYQKQSRGETITAKTEENKEQASLFKDMKEGAKVPKSLTFNDTDENWPDFSNLAKLVT